MNEGFTPFLHFTRSQPPTNKFIMAGKLFNLFALLVSLVGLALAQTQTQAQTQTMGVDGPDATGSISMDITSTVAVADTTTSMADGTDTASSTGTSATGEETTSEVVETKSRTVAVKTRQFTGLPTTTIPNPMRENAARRPSQPGFGKLTVVVGLVTYGLIVM
jgi:hypothetical protein